jgi:prepilin-type N-terminal cleavage/methylation domain-containing protein
LFLLGEFAVDITRGTLRIAGSRVRSGRGHGGFSLAELTVVIAVIGTLCVLSLPLFLSYYQSARVRAAASDVAAQLNLGRQMAIQRNQSICVTIGTSAPQYRQGTCGGTILTGATTDASGNAAAHDGVTLTTTANPIFTNLGAAAPAATITVTQGSRSLNVTVSASGRVTVGP